MLREHPGARVPSDHTLAGPLKRRYRRQRFSLESAVPGDGYAGLEVASGTSRYLSPVSLPTPAGAGVMAMHLTTIAAIIYHVSWLLAALPGDSPAREDTGAAAQSEDP